MANKADVSPRLEGEWIRPTEHGSSITPGFPPQELHPRCETRHCPPKNPQTSAPGWSKPSAAAPAQGGFLPGLPGERWHLTRWRALTAHRSPARALPPGEETPVAEPAGTFLPSFDPAADFPQLVFMSNFLFCTHRLCFPACCFPNLSFLPPRMLLMQGRVSAPPSRRSVPPYSLFPCLSPLCLSTW